MTKLTRDARVALFASGLLIAAPGLLLAQTQNDPAPPADTATNESSAAPIEDRKIDQFAAAFVAIQNIQGEAARQLNDATNETQATEVKAAAEKRMIEAVQREGLAVEEFNRIADLMTTDLQLRSKVAEKVEKRRKG